MIQLEGPTRFAADGIAANADPVTGITIVTFRWRGQTIRPAPTWDDANPAPALGQLENEVELSFKNSMTATAFNQVLLDAVMAGTSSGYFAAALLDEAVSATNPLYYATILLTGVERGGQVRQENIQRQTFPCGPILSVAVDPVA